MNLFGKKRIFNVICLVISLFVFYLSPHAEENQAELNGAKVYSQIKDFALTGGSAEVSGLTLKRDRVQMTFNGIFYFTSEISGKVTGAVFIGQGNVQMETIPSDFEKANINRLIGSETVQSDFKTAV